MPWKSVATVKQDGDGWCVEVLVRTKVGLRLGVVKRRAEKIVRLCGYKTGTRCPREGHPEQGVLVRAVSPWTTTPGASAARPDSSRFLPNDRRPWQRAGNGRSIPLGAPWQPDLIRLPEQA